MRDDALRLRDVLNVSYGALHRSAGPLELGEEYWSLRGSLAAAELFILRTLSFHPDPPGHVINTIQYNNIPNILIFYTFSTSICYIIYGRCKIGFLRRNGERLQSHAPQWLSCKTSTIRQPYLTIDLRIRQCLVCL